MHTPAFLKEVIEGLAVKPGGLYIDGTFGEGGHSKEIVKLGGKVLGIDLDEEQVAKRGREEEREEGAEKEGEEEKRRGIKVIQGNYGDIEKIAKENGFFPVDGVLLDFGLSMEQIARSGRGFSYKNSDEPLDMRISGASSTRTAADIINSSNREELYEIFTRNSEEISAQSISNALKSAGHVEKVGDLVRALGTVHASESTLKRIFQALRIEVNNEFENIQKGIEGTYEITKPGGRIVIISFHSLEDRIVKRWARARGIREVSKRRGGEDWGIGRVGPPAGGEERKRGRRFERSAVLRVFEK